MPPTQLPPTNLPYLFAALAISWIAFFAYVFFLSRRQSELEKEVKLLRLKLEEGDTR